MLRYILKNVRNIKFAVSQIYKIYKKGSLINSFYHSKLIFIHVPKTAGLSIISAIYGDVTKEGHRDISFYKYIFYFNFKKYFTFSFVRNPYDRLYSSFKFLEKGGLNIHDEKAFTQYLSSYNDFNDFVINGLNEDIINKITHFVPQYKFICNQDREILVDFLGKFESIDKDISILSEILEKEITLPLININHSKIDYTEIYTEEMRKIVRRVYRFDFELFNY